MASQSMAWTSSVIVTWKPGRHAGSQPPPRPAESESALEQDPQVLALHVEVREVLRQNTRKSVVLGFNQSLEEEDLRNTGVWNQGLFLCEVRGEIKVETKF